MQENQLIDKCLRGDGIAFKQLINNYRSQLFGYMWRYSNSRFEAEEMFQETLIKVWKGLKKYNHQQKFSSWLFTIGHNVAMDSIRRRKKDILFSSIADNFEMHAPNKPDEEITREEQIRLINESVDGLSEKQKAVFLLRQHGDLTFKEIAETINEPLNTVISHMHYAIKKIKKQLEVKDEPRRKAII